MITKKQVQLLIDQQQISFIYLQFSDLLGQPKNVITNPRTFIDSLDTGIWFDGSSIEGFARIAESDMFLKPDLSTFAILPWSHPKRKSARVICDIYQSSGRRSASDPRFILQKAVAQAKKMGYQYKVGAEVEFYLFERDKLPLLVPHDTKSYFDSTPHSRASTVCERVMNSLSTFGITSEIHHHEVGSGQHEIDIRFDDAVKSADNIVTVKMALKAYTANSQLKVTWMPKPIFGLAGSGMHTHQSLWRHGDNVFYDPKNIYALSPLALHFLAGQLAHASALSAIVSPTVNSYKRLVPGYEAPVNICWGQKNRSALIRVPQSPPSKAANATRLEYRAPDLSCNPYLCFAALLNAGLDGIKHKLTTPPPVEENVYHLQPNQLMKNHITTLPSNLNQAIKILEDDLTILNTLGLAKDIFLQIKSQEWHQFSASVTPWEIDKYL